MQRNPFRGGDGRSTDQRVIDLHLATHSLDWSLYPDMIIEAHCNLKQILEEESIKAMKRMSNLRHQGSHEITY